MKTSPSLVLALLLSACLGRAEQHAQPNILWITAEDMSPTLGCYGDAYADTPHIDAFAKRSLQFTNVFATAPVCSPARACLINGVIATSQGAHQMRSAYPLPEQMLGFPSLLRAAGYYTTNNSKTDYNSAHAEKITAASWDASGPNARWRGRRKGQPFFSVFNLMTSHQSRSMVWSYEQFQTEVQGKLPADRIHDAASAPIPPYYPDTPLVRKTVARYYDCVSVMDQQVGEILEQLHDDGLTDSTIIFFFSDHGSGMPRHKRALLDSGMRVPLLLHIPKSMSKPANVRLDRMISFEDFAQTVLRLAGIMPPNWMRGDSFLAPMRPSRQFVFGHRDRVDEIWDLARSVRGKRYLYIRNFMPHLGYNQQGAWIDQAAMRKEFYKLANNPNITPAQRHFVIGSRPIEELYDCREDPQNLINLARHATHQATLYAMRRALHENVVATRDLGFIPETEMLTLSQGRPPAEWAARNPARIRQGFAAASLVGRGSTAEFTKLLKGQDVEQRYWGAVGLTAQSPPDSNAIEPLKLALADPSPSVRIEAANALALRGIKESAFLQLARLLKHEDLTVVLHAARTIELLGEQAATLRPQMQALFDRHEEQPGDPAWFIRFSTTGFLSRLKAAK